jgi:HlyD family secretion protein
MSRKGVYAAIGGAVVVIGAIAGFATLDGASVDVDPSRIATAELGTMIRSVVATGKIEPITKVEIKSKANGIIKALHVDLDSVVNEGDILVEL